MEFGFIYKYKFWLQNLGPKYEDVGLQIQIQHLSSVCFIIIYRKKQFLWEFWSSKFWNLGMISFAIELCHLAVGDGLEILWLQYCKLKESKGKTNKTMAVYFLYVLRKAKDLFLKQTILSVFCLHLALSGRALETQLSWSRD